VRADIDPRQRQQAQLAALKPSFRADQILRWIYDRRATSWDAMSNLPKTLRDRLQTHFALRPIKLVRKQGSPDTAQSFFGRSRTVL
jgi:23S rRNA (adenine2503-C2)-methyltransferase